MFLEILLPLTDLRPFLASASQSVTSPRLTLADPGRDFIRSFGVVRKRERGGVDGLKGEEVYCDARGALRFPAHLGHKAFGTRRRPRLLCIFRRFLSDGRAVGRFEVGVRSQAGRSGSDIWTAEDCLSFVQDFLSVSVNVADQPDRSTSVPLLRCGNLLAKTYLRATTMRSKGTPITPQGWWIQAGNPVVLLEYRFNELESLPKHCREVPLGSQHNIKLHHLAIQKDGIDLSLWLLGRDKGYDRQLFRRLRIYMLRLHAERDSVLRVLRNLRPGRVSIEKGVPESEELDAFLNDGLTLLSREYHAGLPQRSMLQAAQGIYDQIKPGERDSLLSSVESAKRNLRHRLSSLLTSLEKRETGVTVITNHYDQRKTIMNDVVNYGVLGSNNHLENSNVSSSVTNSQNTIKNSVAAQDLKDHLNELTRAVQAMLTHLPSDGAEEAARDLESFTKEVTAQKPRQKWYQVSADGLLDAAKKVGTAAEPVIKVISAILPLLASIAS